MSKVRFDLSENSFIGALVIVASAVGSVVGVAALFVHDPTTLVGIAAGAAWALSLCLLVMNATYRKALHRLENELDNTKADLANSRKQADHWSVTAATVSQATLTVLQMVPQPSNPPPRRIPAASQVVQEPRLEEQP